MNFSQVIDDMMEEKLLNLHTAFIAKVISVQNESLCSVQPLDRIKAYGKKSKSQAVITRVPILHHVRHFKLVNQTSEANTGQLKVQPLQKGDVVLCVCVERDMSSSIKGGSSVPPVGHHEIKDAVVVGLIGGW